MATKAVYGLVAAVSMFAIGSTATDAASENAADIASGETCFCVTCGTVLGIGPLVTFDARAVQTSSGNVTFQCHFDIPEGFAPVRALRPESAIGCLTPFGVANKVDIVIAPGGKAKLTCQVNPSGD
jgi:hypothetical protein